MPGIARRHCRVGSSTFMSGPSPWNHWVIAILHHQWQQCKNAAVQAVPSKVPFREQACQWHHMGIKASDQHTALGLNPLFIDARADRAIHTKLKDARCHDITSQGVCRVSHATWYPARALAIYSLFTPSSRYASAQAYAFQDSRCRVERATMVGDLRVIEK
jgi:hypothetical protein